MYDPTFQGQDSEEGSVEEFDPESIDLEQKSITEEEEELEEELEEDLEEATAALGMMTVNAPTTAKELSNRFVYPSLMYNYIDNRQKKLTFISLSCVSREKIFT